MIKLNHQGKNVVKWVLYSVIVFVLYIFQTTVGFLEFFGVKPIFVLPVIVFIAMFENEWSSGFFAVVAGLFWDVAADKLLGFNAAILLILAVSISLLSMYLIRARFWNGLLVAAAATLFHGLSDYFCCYLIWGVPDNHLVLFGKILPTAVYTVLISPLLFLLIRKVALEFNGE